MISKAILQARSNFQRLLAKHTGAVYHNQAELAALDLISYIRHNEAQQFDSAITSVPKRFLYSETFAPEVYNYYLDRNLEENAYKFILDTAEYHEYNKIPLPRKISSLLAKAPNRKMLEKIRMVLSQLHTLSPENVPKVLPQILNSKINLDEFILRELLSALDLMRVKIAAVRKLGEDMMSDVVVAILRSRLPVWNWHITDQSRSGESPGLKQAGEADIIIRSAQDDLVIIEALVLKTRNFPYLSLHVLKVPNYNRSLSSSVILVYYKGERENFNTFCENYTEDIRNIDYPKNWEYDSSVDFVDLGEDYKNTNEMLVGKTSHGTKNSLYHVVIDLSPREEIKEDDQQEE